MVITTAILAGISLVIASDVRQQPSQQEQQNPAQRRQIHGQILYQEQAGLPATALLNVQIIDITQPELTQRSIVQADIEVENQLPISFTLPLAMEDLAADHLYALQARIFVGDVLWFANAKPMPIFKDKDGYLIRLEQVGMEVSPSMSRLERREWLTERLEGESAIAPYPSLMIDTWDDMTNTTSVAGSRYKVTGTGGCNRYFSTAIIDKERQQLNFSAAGMSFMACTEAIMHQESRFVNMLERVRAYRFEEGGYLYLLDQNDEVLAHLKAS